MRIKLPAFIAIFVFITSPSNTWALANDNKDSFVKTRSSHSIKTIFRVVEAKPDDFIYALKNVDRSLDPSRPAPSRLEQYFRVSEKTVQNGKIKIVVNLLIRYLPDALRKYSTLEILLDELVQSKPEQKSPQFWVNFALSPSAQIHALLTVSPHPRGSLLRLDVQDSTVPTWLIERVIALTIELNLATKAPQ